MIKFNFNLKFIIFFIIFTSNTCFASIQNRIIANVANETISSFELKNKIKITLMLSNQEMTQGTIDKTKGKALKSLIDSRIKKIEITKYKIQPNNKLVNLYLENVSKKYNTDIQGLKKMFEVNEVDYDIYYDEIKIEFAWQNLIFSIFKNKVNVTENEIEEELNQFIDDRKDLVEFELSEIEILLDNNAEDKNKINEIIKLINTDGFEKAAIKASISSSSLDGGKLGWISSKSLSTKILTIIENMKLNEVSEPILQANTVMFLKLLNKKTLNFDSIEIDKLKKQITERRKNELLDLFSNSYLSRIKNNTLIQIK
jgi:peptidyl-prolyl cis-trans isomerase SurA